MFLKKKAHSLPGKGPLMEASQAPLGEMFMCKRAFLELLKSRHPGSHFRARKRLSLTPSHTCTPTLALLLPTAPLPRTKATIKLCSHPGRLCANIYIAPLRGLQQTQHGGATLGTLSRPQSWPGVADSPQCWQAGLAPGRGWDRMPPSRPGRPLGLRAIPPCSLGGRTLGGDSSPVPGHLQVSSPVLSPCTQAWREPQGEGSP